MPKMIGFINEDQSIVTKQFVEGLAETRVPTTRKINGQELTEDINIELNYIPITNEEIDEICGQLSVVWNGELYIRGTDYTDITGGWVVGNVPPPGWSSYKTATLTNNSDNMVFTGRLNTLYTSKKINVTNYTTMVFKGSVNAWSTIRIKPTKDSQENGAYSDWNPGQEERRVDISSLTGEHYICLSIYDADNRQITLTEVYME